MPKPGTRHIILEDLLQGVGFTEKKQTLLESRDGGTAVYLYFEPEEDLLQIVYDPMLSPRFVCIAKKISKKNLIRHIYRRHGTWKVRENALNLTVDGNGNLS